MDNYNCLLLGARNMQQNKSKWMWYKDDFELFHSHKLHSRRSERGVIFSVQWCIPAVYNNVMLEG